MFADVSGFTALGEAMLRKYDVGGAEYLARHLNSYFSQMVKIIASEGGDIFKFAGDAMIVLWPDLDPVQVRCRRAAQVSAVLLHAVLANGSLDDGGSLAVFLCLMRSSLRLSGVFWVT
jgi:class 3 adenylate cyclase